MAVDQQVEASKSVISRICDKHCDLLDTNRCIPVNIMNGLCIQQCLHFTSFSDQFSILFPSPCFITGTSDTPFNALTKPNYPSTEGVVYRDQEHNFSKLLLDGHYDASLDDNEDKTTIFRSRDILFTLGLLIEAKRLITGATVVIYTYDVDIIKEALILCHFGLIHVGPSDEFNIGMPLYRIVCKRFHYKISQYGVDHADSVIGASQIFLDYSLTLHVLLSLSGFKGLMRMTLS